MIPFVSVVCHSRRCWKASKSDLEKEVIETAAKTTHCFVILILLLMVGLLGNTLAGEVMKLGENDSGKTLEMRVGDELEIGLPGNPTTGYIWEVCLLDSNLLSQGKGDFFANDKAIGAGGMEIIKLHAIAEGKTDVKLVYDRPFELDNPPLKTFAVTITIRK